MKKLLTVIRAIISMPLLLLLLFASVLTPIILSVSKLADADYIIKTVSEVGLFDELAESMLEDFQLEEKLSEESSDTNMSEVFDKINVGSYLEDYTATIVTEFYAWMDGNKETFVAEIDAQPMVEDIFTEMGMGSEFEGFAASNTLKSTVTLEDLNLTEKEADDLKDGYKYLKNIGIISIFALVIIWGITVIMIPGFKKGIKISNVFVILGALIIFLLTFVITIPTILNFVQDESVSAEDIAIATNMAEIVVEIVKNVRFKALALIGFPLFLNILLNISTRNNKKSSDLGVKDEIVSNHI